MTVPKYGEVFEHGAKRIMVIGPDTADIDEELGPWCWCVVLTTDSKSYAPGFVGSWDAFGTHWKRVDDAS